MDKKMLPVISIGIVSLALGLGCKPVISYNSAQAIETVNVDFGSTDLQIIADKIVASLISSDRLKPDIDNPDQLPLVSVSRLRNGTSEHIDTKSITDKIRTALIKSGKVRFSASEAQEDLMDQYDLQRYVASSKTRKVVGKQIGSKYILGGDISSIVKTAGRVKDVYYKVNLQLTNISSAEIEWAEEVEIRKDSIRSIFGH
jgi:hypothetical protein